MSRKAEVQKSYELVEKIRPILAGNRPDAQGAAIAQLVATFIASHAPPLRKTARQLLLDCADGLVPVEVAAMVDSGRVPPYWSEDTDMSKMTAEEVDAACDRLDRLLVDGMALIRKGDADGALLILQEALKTATGLPSKKKLARGKR